MALTQHGETRDNNIDSRQAAKRKDCERQMSKLLPARNGIVTPKKMIAEQWLIDSRGH
jgi:hypothetical protein